MVRRSYNKNYVKRYRKRYIPKNIARIHYRRPIGNAIKNRYPRVPFPIQRYVKLHLNYQGSITSTTGSFGNMGALKLNSCFDPTGGLGATQPRWYDQMTALYNKYACYGCKVVAVISNAEKIGQVGMACYDSSAPSSMLELDERENCVTRVIDASTGSKTQVILKRYFNFPKIVGIPKKQYVNEDDYLTTVTADPANIVYGDIFYQTYGAQTGTVSVKLHLTMYVRFSALQDPADS